MPISKDRMKKMHWTSMLFLVAVLASNPIMSNAQTTLTPVEDFSGYIKKYDPNFKGIGPEVYFLPPPATAEELLLRELKNRTHETLSIPDMLSKANALSGLKGTGNMGTNPEILSGQKQSREAWLLLESERLSVLGKLDDLSDIYHLLGCEYFRIGAMDDALGFFEKALTGKMALKKEDDALAIQQNIAALYEYTGDIHCAWTHYDALFRDAIRKNNRLLEANMRTRKALLTAKRGNHYEAEQEIIRTIIPLYRQIRSEAGDIGRILAYRTLAEVYMMQKRHPEAQWFLLQSKEIIDQKGLNYYLPDILFALAEVKKSSGNTTIAIKEYLWADELIHERGKDSLVMRLAIQEALGSIYHQSGQIKEALEALNRYDYLKQQLISLDFPF